MPTRSLTEALGEEQDLTEVADLILVMDAYGMKLPVPEEVEILPDIQPPLPEPGVPSIYVDCRVPYRDLGYSTAPKKSRVVPLSKKQYTSEEADARFEEMRAANGWRVVGGKFWDARWWCWRIEVES